MNPLRLPSSTSRAEQGRERKGWIRHRHPPGVVPAAASPRSAPAATSTAGDTAAAPCLELLLSSPPPNLLPSPPPLPLELLPPPLPLELLLPLPLALQQHTQHLKAFKPPVLHGGQILLQEA
ncbi:hypothetical protein GUJ93_ZPchr0006g46354 [Zizania palustris]|uniref:Uncharacterized protein n=1 Tax=Zizania palustris TaxID=103762 RepID=A0A8J5SYQ9_ZIZPA|nr:hypothetical protein GUJ93_ZPchr0006g46354 [Zizania palustris]